MTAYLERNTVQKVQQFLGTLDINPPPYATSQQVLDILVQRVRERGDEIAFRQDLQALLNMLARTDGVLPGDQSEIHSPEALANELAGLLASSEAASQGAGKHGVSLTALATVMLWAAITTSAGCDPVAACMDDVSTENFEAIAASGEGIQDCEAEAYANNFDARDATEQTAMIEDLCAMTPAEITAYITAEMPDSNCTDGDDDDGADDDAVYKGVSF